MSERGRSGPALLVQRADPERFFATLFAPPAQREILFTLYAFNHELARAREVTTQPPLALIRLHWWREVVEGAAKPHEVATPLLAALDAGHLRPHSLLRIIDAREHEAAPSIGKEGWRAYLRDTGGALMEEAGRVLGATDEECAHLAQLGAGAAAAGAVRNEAAHAAIGRWCYADGESRADAVAYARAMLGTARPWRRNILPAALPAAAARHHLNHAKTRPATARPLLLWHALRVTS